MQYIKRDIKIMDKNNGTNGIYFYPSETNIYEGYGLIIGTEDTPYHGGFYLIKFEYPRNYPIEHPTCTFLSVSGIRHNPNLYEDGQVCLSILGTWGDIDTWTKDMTTEQVLLAIQSQVLTKNAIDNEPEYDWSISHPVLARHYEEIVRHSNYKYNVIHIYDHIPVLDRYANKAIKNTLRQYLLENEQQYIKQLESLQEHNNIRYHCKFYNNTVICCYSDLLTSFRSMIHNIRNPVKRKKIVLKKRSV